MRELRLDPLRHEMLLLRCQRARNMQAGGFMWGLRMRGVAVSLLIALRGVDICGAYRTTVHRCVTFFHCTAWSLLVTGST